MERNRLDELRSTEVQEILSHIPHWIIRWGITVFFFTLFMILLASWFIKYPEVVQARVLITSKNPPASIIARTSGNLVKFVQEGDTVKKGDYLGAIENAADMDDIFRLRQQIDTFKLALLDPAQLSKPFAFDEDVNLGELQGEYLAFTRAYTDYLFEGELDYHEKQVTSLKEQVKYYEKLNTELETQRKLLERELELVLRDYKRDQELFNSKMISQVALDNSESAYIQAQRAYESARTNIISNSIQISELEKRVMDLALQGVDSDKNSIQILQEAFRKLQGSFAIWEQQYMLKSPTQGIVSFFKFWTDNQFVSQGEEVMTIVPDSEDIFGMMQVPMAGSGKVKTGQRVKIRFDNFPATEYGMVEATVESISAVPRNNMYAVRVKLNKGLVTTYKKSLEFRTEMQGNADIVTDNLRIFERIFNQLRSIFNNSLET